MYGPSARSLIRRQTSSPSMPGIIQSRMISSGGLGPWMMFHVSIPSLALFEAQENERNGWSPPDPHPGRLPEERRMKVRHAATNKH